MKINHVTELDPEAEKLIFDREVNYRYGLLTFKGDIEGDYDLSHLQNFHKELLEGTVRAHQGGVLRAKDPEGSFYWRKRDVFIFDNLPASVISVHSHMTEADINELCSTLQELNTDRNTDIMTGQFTRKLAAIYVKCDYIHPFNDANTRTLSAFLSQYSRKCGFLTPFELTYSSPEKKNDFYIARALSESTYGLALLDMTHDEEHKRILKNNMELFKDRQNFAQFLNTNTYPVPAFEFKQFIDYISDNSENIKTFTTAFNNNAYPLIEKYPHLKIPSIMVLQNAEYLINRSDFSEELKSNTLKRITNGICSLLKQGYRDINNDLLKKELHKIKTMNLNNNNNIQLNKTDMDR